jgi:hypothetical protein
MPAALRNARFKFTDCTITRVNSLGKVTYLTVVCWAGGKYPDYFDVTVFHSDAELGRWGEGEAVNISGELSKRKPKEAGGPRTLELIARKIEQGNANVAPVPKERPAAPAPSQDHDDDVSF